VTTGSGLLILLALALAAPARPAAASWQAAAASGQPARPKPAEGASRKPGPRESAAIERRLSEAVRRDPASFQARQALAGFYLQQRKLDAAIPHLEQARAIDPAHYATGYDLAVALIETGRLAPAREQVQRMLRAKETAELHNLTGDLDEREGNFPGAAVAFQRAAHMDPTEEHLFDWGNSLVQLRAFEPAADVFTAAIARHPKSGRLHVGLGIAQYSRGQYEDAVKSFCQAADLAPADPRPIHFLGEMYGVVPDLAGDVTRRLARFVKAEPRNALAHFYYAMSLWKEQSAGLSAADTRRVEALLRRAVALDPALAKAFLQLGIFLSDRQRYREAIESLRSAARLEPSLAQAHYRLAQAYQRTGQPDLAAKELDIFEQLKGTSR
jgi:tetratricopeptide (TPR) repeat protein